MSDGKDGRPQALTKEQLLAAVKRYKTVSIAELTLKLNVGRATVYRRMQDVTPAEVAAAIGTDSNATLTPAQHEKSVFELIPEIQKFKETLSLRRETGKAYTARMISALFRVCTHLNIHPTALTPEAAAEVILAIRRKDGSVPFGESEARKGLRAWFGFRGIGEEHLTNLGIDGRYKRVGRDRSMLKINHEQRLKFMEVLRRKVMHNWQSGRYHIDFGDNPKLAFAAENLPEHLFYTGTRIGVEADRGALSEEWSDVRFSQGIAIIRVVDKGKHGGITWFKKLIGAPATRFAVFYDAVGNPSNGKIYPFDYAALGALFRECYIEAGISREIWAGMVFHIWRHTAAQEMLDATDWNYGTVAKTLGWETTLALEKHYGKMPDASQLRALQKAMGLPVIEEKREFKF